MVSEYIHVSTSLIYRMVSLGQIPYIKVGSRTIFDRVQIDQWLRNHCRIVEELPQVPKM
ncbi:MAG: helix-turn-helix domain-containing protein [Clostridia bacterium]|nr:helix-turn-helix domain-containing protein [Clostridia bacterium]